MSRRNRRPWTEEDRARARVLQQDEERRASEAREQREAERAFRCALVKGMAEERGLTLNDEWAGFLVDLLNSDELKY